MDNTLLSETSAFVEKMKKSDVYINYINSKKQLELKPNLKAQLDDFRKNSFEIQLGHKYGYYNCYEQLVNLKNVNDELLSNSLVKEFMEDELKLTKMISSIINCMAVEIDFDIDFLE